MVRRSIGSCDSLRYFCFDSGGPCWKCRSCSVGGGEWGADHFVCFVLTLIRLAALEPLLFIHSCFVFIVFVCCVCCVCVVMFEARACYVCSVSGFARKQMRSTNVLGVSFVAFLQAERASSFRWEGKNSDGFYRACSAYCCCTVYHLWLSCRQRERVPAVPK